MKLIYYCDDHYFEGKLDKIKPSFLPNNYFSSQCVFVFQFTITSEHHHVKNKTKKIHYHWSLSNIRTYNRNCDTKNKPRDKNNTIPNKKRLNLLTVEFHGEKI